MEEFVKETFDFTIGNYPEVYTATRTNNKEVWEVIMCGESSDYSLSTVQYYIEGCGVWRIIDGTHVVTAGSAAIETDPPAPQAPDVFSTLKDYVTGGWGSVQVMKNNTFSIYYDQMSGVVLSKTIREDQVIPFINIIKQLDDLLNVPF